MKKDRAVITVPVTLEIQIKQTKAVGMSGIYPITDEELEAAELALDEATEGCASLTSCVHAVLGAVERLRESKAKAE